MLTPSFSKRSGLPHLLVKDLLPCFAVRDTVLANSSAGLVASGMASNYLEGIEIARSSLKSGKALDKLTQLVKYSGGDVAVTEELLRKI